MMTGFLALLFAFSALARPAWAGEPVPKTLGFRQALQLARERHVEVVLAEERVQRAIERLSEAGSVLRPQLTATVSQSRQTRNLEAMGITIPGRDPLVGPFNTFDGRLRWNQPLFDAEALDRLKAARADRALSEAESARAREDALALAATLYLEARRAGQSVELARAVADWAQARLELAQARLRSGSGTAVEEDQASAELESARHRLRAAEAEAVERRLDLAVALGLDPETPPGFAEESPEELSSESFREGGPNAALDSPDVRVARAHLERRSLERSVERSARLPSLSASADYGLSGTTPGRSLGTYSVGGQVSLPIYEGGRTSSRIDQAEGRLKESRIQLEDVESRSKARFLSAEEELIRAGSRLEAGEAGLLAADKDLSVVEEKAEAGSAGALELIEARARRAAALDELRAAQTGVRLAQVGMARALGRMGVWAGDGMEP